MSRAPRLALAALCLAAGPLGGQAPSPGAMDSLLDALVGRWQMTGTVRGHPVVYDLDVARVLQGRFVELHMTEAHVPPQYEARVFVGVDGAAHQYAAHCARYSVPPAAGEARGDTVLLNFPYLDGAFRDTVVYDRRSRTWSFRLEAADSTPTTP